MIINGLLYRIIISAKRLSLWLGDENRSLKSAVKSEYAIQFFTMNLSADLYVSIHGDVQRDKTQFVQRIRINEMK